MSDHSVDIAVLGAGFAGSLAAWLLAKQGYSVALIEHGKHPRFAIGESSTPLADFKLHQIAQRYALPELNAFTQYGRWKLTHPDITCGIKRGFAYFYHQEGQAFQTDDAHTNELLVTANASREASDTHWLREDLDAYFVQRAIDSGAGYFDETTIEDSHSTGVHRIRASRAGRALTFEARFLIVATGSPKLWKDALPFPSTGKMPRTHTGSVFAHFADLLPWETVCNAKDWSTVDYPFPCDQSALHHVFDGGWMWQLRFDDQTTSVGFSIDHTRHGSVTSLSKHAPFQAWLDRLPDVKAQFVNARIIRPAAGMQCVERLQQELRQPAGDRWALLPAAVGFADPLFSTGIAHALFSVDRLVDALRELDRPIQLSERLREYGERMSREIDLLDRLVSLAYRATGDFEKFVATTMSYFAAATTCERTSKDAQASGATPAFLLAEHPEFLDAIRRIENGFSHSSSDQFVALATETLAPFNHVGLFKPEVPRMYRYTAAPK